MNNQSQPRTPPLRINSNAAINTKCSKIFGIVLRKENILMLILILTKVILFSIMLSKNYTLIIAICDGINIAFTIIAYIIQFLEREYALYVKWAVYTIYFSTQIIVSFITQGNENESNCTGSGNSDGNGNDNESNSQMDCDNTYAIVKYLITNLYIQNSLIFIIGSQCKMKKFGLLTQLCVMILLNVILLIIINITQNKLTIYDSIFFCNCFIIAYSVYYLNYHEKEEQSRLNKNKERCINNGPYDIPSDYEDMNTIYGSCIVNRNMKIKYKNAYFKMKMNDMSIKPNSIMKSQRDDIDDHQSIKTTSYQHCFGILVSVSNANLLLNKNNEDEENLNYDCIMFRDDEGDDDGYENSNRNSAKVTLKDIFTNKCVLNLRQISNFRHSPQSNVHQSQSQNQNKNGFVHLGKYEFLSNKEVRYYEIHCRNISVLNSNSNSDSNSSSKKDKKEEPLYEIAFYELADSSQKKMNQIEKKYKGLLLRIINHEFKVPIVLIQNMTNEINETTTSVYTKSIAKTIKYVTEIILLLVSDLTDYIHLNTLECEEKEMKSKPGTVDLYSFYQDIKNISFVYTKLYNTNANIRYYFNQLLKNCSIEINETKLKQILSILIINAIKHSTNVQIRLNVKDANGQYHNARSKVNSSTLLKNTISILKSTQETQINDTNGNNNLDYIYILKPKASEGDYTHDYKLSISIEDNGPGIDVNLMKSINLFFTDDQFKTDIIQAISADEFKIPSAFKTGLMICLKLCKDLGVFLQCELLYQNSAVKGCRFTLDLDYKITFEEGRNNDSCIYENENEIESSNCGLTNQSVVTNQLDLEDFILTYNDKQYLSSSMNNDNDNDNANYTFNQVNEANSVQASVNSNSNSNNRKSKTCLYFKSSKSKFATNTNTPQVEMCYVQCHVHTFSINSCTSSLTQIQKKKLQNNQDKNIPLFNDYDRTFSRSIDKYSLSRSFRNKSALINKNDSGQLIKKGNSETKSDLAGENNICIVKELKEQSKDTSSQVISQFNRNYKLFNSRKKKSNESIVKEIVQASNKNDIPSVNSSAIEKNIIVIVDDIDSNKKAIYLMVKKHLAKKDKGDLYDFRLLSDGIELVNLFYTDSVTQNNLIKIIFCDESMNFINGSEAFGMIKKIANTYNVNKIPFILCSAFCDNSFKEKMLSIGVTNVYGKPLQSSSVEKIIEEFNL